MQKLTRTEFISSISKMAGSVYDFHERFGFSPIDPLASPEEVLEKLRTRLVLLIEEVGEHATELNRGNIGEAMLEIADVAFVVLGTLLVLDEPGRDVAKEVVSKNDRKTVETHVFLQSSGKLVRKSSDA